MASIPATSPAPRIRKPARWLLPSPEPDTVARLARECGISAPVARILAARGYIDSDAALRFLRPSLDHMHDPFLLAGMKDAATRLAAAVANKEPVMLYGDYDVDGTSAIVILHTVLRLAGAQVSYHVPHRIREGYGMRTEVVEKAQADGVKLIVSVDTGIRANEVVSHAGTLGIDVIVTDHHLPEAELPPAVAVLNPNRPDCSYPEKNLCGAAVAWKLAAALTVELGWPVERREKLMSSLLKLAAIATVADVVPLTGENRVIVTHGLAGLRDPRNPGLKALLEIAGIPAGTVPSARQVGFQIGPRINAAGRMDDARNVIEMFLTADADFARQMAERLDSLNRERQLTEAQIRDEIVLQCEQMAIGDEHAGLVFSAPGWHQGVIGIVAGRLAERFSRPVFVLSEDPETGLAHGSGRSPALFHLLESLESMPELFNRFGGHRQAAGLQIDTARIPEFRERFQAFAAARLDPEDLRPVHSFDAEAALDELDDAAAAELLSLAPFGNANPPPLLALRAVQVAAPPDIKNTQHLFVRLRQNGAAVQAKGWGLAHLANEIHSGDTLDAAVVLEEDTWSRDRGRGFWCLVLKDVRPPEH